LRRLLSKSGSTLSSSLSSEPAKKTGKAAVDGAIKLITPWLGFLGSKKFIVAGALEQFAYWAEQNKIIAEREWVFIGIGIGGLWLVAQMFADQKKEGQKRIQRRQFENTFGA